MQKLVSGITATGQLTLGNYIGAIKNFIKLKDQYEMFIFVADLHALATDIKPKILRQNKASMMALYIAAGLDPQQVTLFYQSDVVAHGMMNWIMESRTTKGELERMTQFKDKALKGKMDNGTIKIKTTLLTYPALMAGDILLYNPEIVPVGIDQKQHLELTRNIASRFNQEFGLTFNIPEPFFPKVGAKIKSLQDPTKKMSKSDPNQKASIFLLDDPQQAFNKIKRAVTDSENKIYYDEVKKPGVANLLNIYSALTDQSIAAITQEFVNQDYGAFKLALGNIVKDFLIDLQTKYAAALKIIDQIAAAGAQKANQVANKMLAKVERKIGLR